MEQFKVFLKEEDLKAEVFRKINKKSNSQANIKELPCEETINTMAEFLSIFESFITENKKIKHSFDSLLRKKFIDHVDSFEFLDPFAAEFKYSRGKIDFTGRKDEKKFIQSILTCIEEIAVELGIKSQIKPFYKNRAGAFLGLAGKYGLFFPFE